MGLEKKDFQGLAIIVAIIIITNAINLTFVWVIAIAVMVAVAYIFMARPALRAAREQKKIDDAMKRHITTNY